MNDNKSIEQRYRETKVKENRQGFDIITKWSCDFAKDKNNPDVKKYINTLNIQDPIDVRDCYFGGRTNGLLLHKIFTEGEKGYYVDFTSLYPDILKYRRFPVGLLERITDNFQFCYVKTCDGNCFYDNFQGLHWALP